MGSEWGSDDERPVHPVTIAEPFFLGATEVTFAQYKVPRERHQRRAAPFTRDFRAYVATPGQPHRGTISGPSSSAPGRQRPAMLGGTDRQRFQDPLPQPPAVGMADVGDPAADAGVQLGEADVPRVIGGQPGMQAAVGVAHLACLHQAMGRVDNEAEPGDARGDGHDLGAGLVDD
jgi:hypothetical protein